MEFSYLSLFLIIFASMDLGTLFVIVEFLFIQCLLLWSSICLRLILNSYFVFELPLCKGLIFDKKGKPFDILLSIKYIN